MAPARVRIFTLGCKVNQCDSDEIARSLAARGYDLSERGEADTYIVNTCTVTSTADAKARKLIRRLAREHPEATLIVTGCLAQRDPYSLLQLPGVSAVIPNNRKLQLADFLSPRPGPLFPSTYLSPRTRSFVRVQDGCDHRCTYCAVPDARGRPTSKPLHQVLEELTNLVKAGVQEVVLCGIRLGAYGHDRGDATLALLLHRLRDLPLPRLRLSSIEPMDFNGDLLAELADHPSLCHHLHFPLQSGDDDILAAMGRGYTTTDFAALVSRLRAVWPEVALTTDLMVGFPGETDDQFANSLRFVRDNGFARVHVFPFSRRPGTPAAERADQVSAQIKHERTQQALALAEELSQTAARLWIGRSVSVLFEEREKGELLTGHSPHYIKIYAPGPDDWIGRIMEVIPGREEGGELIVGASGADERG